MKKLINESRDLKINLKQMAQEGAEFIKIWHSMNHHLRPKVHEINDEVSMAVPEQAMSMREMLNRHVTGMEITGKDNPKYEEEGENKIGIDFRSLDLVDIQEIKQQTKIRYNELLQTAKKEREDYHAKQKQEADEKLVKQFEEYETRKATYNKKTVAEGEADKST